MFRERDVQAKATAEEARQRKYVLATVKPNLYVRNCHVNSMCAFDAAGIDDTWHWSPQHACEDVSLRKRQ